MGLDGTVKQDSTPATRAVLSQEHLETIFNATHDAVLVLDGNAQTVMHANPRVYCLFGYQPGQVIGAPFSQFVAEGDPTRLAEAQLVDGVFGPIQIRCGDGSLRDVDVTVAVIPWDGVPALLYSLRDVTQRTQLEEERARLIRDLREALAKVKQLSGLLPICASCKRIRNDDGYWATVEQYITTHSEAEFSHGICPECREVLYPELGPGRRDGNPAI